MVGQFFLPGPIYWDYFCKDYILALGKTSLYVYLGPCSFHGKVYHSFLKASRVTVYPSEYYFPAGLLLLVWLESVLRYLTLLHYCRKSEIMARSFLNIFPLEEQLSPWTTKTQVPLDPRENQDLWFRTEVLGLACLRGTHSAHKSWMVWLPVSTEHRRWYDLC